MRKGLAHMVWWCFHWFLVDDTGKRCRKASTCLLRNNTVSIVLQLRNGMASYCSVEQLDSLDLARLRNGTASYCPVGQRYSLHLARFVTGLPRCVTGYRGFGVMHPDLAAGHTTGHPLT